MTAQTSAPHVDLDGHRNKMDQCPKCLWWSTDISKHNCPIVSPSPDSGGVEALTEALEPFLKAAKVIAARPQDYHNRIAMIGGLIDACDLTKRHFSDLLKASSIRPQASAGERGWQPIETAPKDKNVLVVHDQSPKIP